MTSDQKEEKEEIDQAKALLESHSFTHGSGPCPKCEEAMKALSKLEDAIKWRDGEEKD